MASNTGSKRKKAGTARAAKKPTSASSNSKGSKVTKADDRSKPKRKPTGAIALAAAILEEDGSEQQIAEQGELLFDARSTTATKAARVIHEIANADAKLVVPIVDKLARGVRSKHKRVVQTSADALPLIARVAPARVARQLEVLKGSFDEASAVGKDGLVRTFAALCTASVAYQKRLEPELTKALELADGKTLLRWCEIVLPALKGEPHARARAVVERRMYQIPRSTAQKIADFLGVRLRHSYRGG